ncbi:MAG: aspartate--tRNA ligase [Clostridiaceae bacterium]|jgi:aspartyl-tRNA synthetase|nr:aspartate--tRNA ligase [Clostridiaceae bacterium]
MAEFFTGLKRTDMCGTLRHKHKDKEVTVMGFAQKCRNLGSLLFIDLRDRTGLVQVAFDSSKNKELFEKAATVRNEYVLVVKGTVRARSAKNKNPNMPTGGIEVEASDLRIVSEAETAPFSVADDVNEQLRLKYRYLDLRRPALQSKLVMRDKIARTARNYLAKQGFLEIETPFLGKSTPEGARDYLVPSRIKKGSFYALPQSPQLYKQLLMIAGMDRYYQIARCFRDEDLRANRQPEFTQIDLEMSFVDSEEDVMEIAEGLIKKLFADCLKVKFTEPFRRLSFEEAMERFGSDKPDTRFGLELQNLSAEVAECGFGMFTDAIAAGGSVRAITVPSGAAAFTRKECDAFGEFVKDFGAKGVVSALFKEGTVPSFFKFLNDGEIAAVKARLSVKDGDAVFIVADKSDKVVFDSLGALRLHIAKKLSLIDESKFDILWVKDFPLYEYSAEDGRYYAMHHPFTSPKNEDLQYMESNPSKVRAKAYDLVINGQEAGGGSVRIHNPAIQKLMFQVLGMSDEEIKERFGFFIEAFKYGTPPHGGLAFGMDRLAMLFTGTDNIKDVIAFPKVQNASCLMTGAPDYVELKQLKELGIELRAKQPTDKGE